MTSESGKPKTKKGDHNVSVPVPPDGGYGWVVVFASFICNMMVDGVTYCFGVFLPDLVAFYEDSPTKVAWVGSILAGVTLCTGPLVSAVANKYGCRVACMAGAVVATTSFGLSVFCPNVELLMLVYGVGGGLGFGLMYVPAVVCVGYYFESKRSLATGIAVCGSGVGTILFAPLGQFLLLNYGWKGANLVLAALCFSCVLFGFLMKPIEYKIEEVEVGEEQPVTVLYQNGAMIKDGICKSYTSLGDVSASRHSLASNRSKRSQVLPPLARQDVLYTGSLRNLKEFQSQKSLHDFRQSMVNIPKTKSRYGGRRLSGICKGINDLLDLSLLKDPAFTIVAVSNMIGFMALYVPFVYILVAALRNGIDTSSASLLISIMGITNTVGRVLCGFVADFPQVNTLLVYNLCQFIMAVAVAGTAFCSSYISYVIVTAVYGSAMAGYISLSSILLVELLGLEKLTSAFGLLILFRGAGALIGPPLAGVIINATGSYNFAFFTACGFLLISTIMSFSVSYIQNTRRKTIPPEQLNLSVNLDTIDEAA